MAIAAIGAGGVALSGILVSVLVPHGPAKISLSADASRAHERHMAQHREMDSQISQRHRRSHWVFSTINNANDPTFNQLLGINNRGRISGYFGSGAAGHPNQGYLLIMGRHRTRYENENVPGALQTQVTGLNDRGVTVGFWSGQNTASQSNDNFGFYRWGGHFATVRFPTANNASPPVNQLLGVNDSDIAVGFYTDAQGKNHGYIYNIARHRFRIVKIIGATSATASGINNRDDIVGFYTDAGGMTKAFVRHWFGRRTTLAYPGASATQAFGINDFGEVAGSYTIGSGTSAKTYGFTWTRRRGFRSISDPRGVGATTINGVNNAGDLVGFYTDAAGNTDGFLWATRHHRAPFAPMPPASPTMMPAPTMSAMPTMTPVPTMTPMPSNSAMPTVSPTTMPSAAPPSTPAPAPTSSASPPGGPW